MLVYQDVYSRAKLSHGFIPFHVTCEAKVFTLFSKSWQIHWEDLPQKNGMGIDWSWLELIGVDGIYGI